MIARTDRERRLLRQLEIAARERQHAEDRRRRNAELRVQAENEAGQLRRRMRRIGQALAAGADRFHMERHHPDQLDAIEEGLRVANKHRYGAGDPDDGATCQPS